MYQKKNKNWGQRTKFLLENKHMFSVWTNMKTRCYNKNTKDYKNYGGRGITVCKEWLIFDNFLKDMKEKFTKGLTLDRINNDKGYSKQNCRWVTRLEQNNNKRNVRRHHFNGLKLTFREWSEKLGISESTLSQRFYVYKWSIEKCLTMQIYERR